jgi:hypothetical protein
MCRTSCVAPSRVLAARSGEIVITSLWDVFRLIEEKRPFTVSGFQCFIRSTKQYRQQKAASMPPSYGRKQRPPGMWGNANEYHAIA